MTDTQPISLGLKTAETAVSRAPQPRSRGPLEIERDTRPPAPAVAERQAFDVGTLADPLVSILSRPVWLTALGLIALVSFLVVNVLVWSSVKQHTPPAAANKRPRLADIDDLVLKAGQKKPLHFAVNRHDCREPLTIRVEGLPEEMKVTPLTLSADEDKASLTLLVPLKIASSKREARVSLWEGDTKLDEKTFLLFLQKAPRPLLKPPGEIACQAGQSASFTFGVQRDDYREPLLVRLEGLPPDVRQESAPAAGADSLSMKLTVAAGLAPQPLSAKLLLCAGDAVLDSKDLVITIQKDAAQLVTDQKPRVRLKDKTPHSLTVDSGKGSSLSVQLERENYPGEVEVRLEDLPPGVTAAPVMVPAGSSSAIVAVETTPETQPAQHNVKLRLLINKQTVEERAIALTVRRGRGRMEIVHFRTVDHMELEGTLYHGWKGKTGMTVLMLHDLGHNRGSPGWKRLAEKLQAEGHTVLTFDFRGHGESKKVSTKFWSYSVNKALPLPVHEPGLPPENQPMTLEGADLPTEYLPWLVEDIAAARTYLDLRHDEAKGPINTFNLVVIGAGQASALGSLWLATEGLRFNAADVGDKIMLKPPEKLSVRCAVWIGMADPLKLRALGILGWLRGAHAKPVIPITFVHGEDDADTANLLAIPLQEKLGDELVLPGVRLSGQQMLDTDAEAVARIRKYLQDKLQALPPEEWVARKIKTLHSYWAIPEQLPGGGKQMRFFVAKRVGEETLSPVPFQPLHVPRIKGLAEPASFLGEVQDR
ncbi:MAG: alpha/beta hydrolase [Gemmataceae bacterium]